MVDYVLIIYPDLPNDPFISKISNPAAARAVAKAVNEGWQVIELQGNDASRNEVSNTLNSRPLLDFVLHFDHGDQNAISGQNNNSKEVIIESNNVQVLNNKLLSTVSCWSACSNGIGSLAIANGAKVYLGYSSTYWPWFGENDCLCDFFIDAANAANFALLEGKSFDQACQIGKEAHYKTADLLFNMSQIIELYVPQSNERDELIDDLTMASALLDWDGDNLTVLGDSAQTAK